MVIPFGLTALLVQIPWKADTALVKQLGPRITIGGYSLQPPKGYEKVEQMGPGGQPGYAWVGPVRGNGTRSMMMLMVLTPPAGDKPRMAAEVAQVMVQGVKGRRTDWSQRKPEAGTLGGLKFSRIAWIGTEPALSAKLQGAHYVAKDNEKFVVLWTQDVMPEGLASFKLCEAAIRTFRKG